MKIIITENYRESCKLAAEAIRGLVAEKPGAKLGLATGSTPVGVYEELIRMNRAGEIDFSAVKTVNLDEYAGLGGSHPQSYRRFMDKNLFDHINIARENTFVASGLGNLEQNAAELEAKAFEGGPADLQLLGIGGNGHIAFNEAGESLTALSHPARLAAETIAANARFFGPGESVPETAVTMGMKAILAARRIILLATGPAKAEAVRGLLSGEISTRNPATFLHLHGDAVVIIDRELADAAGAR